MEDNIIVKLEEIRKAVSPLAFKTVILGQDAILTVLNIMPCSDNIYCVFVDAGELFAVQNMGAMIHGTLQYGSGQEISFLIPVTQILISNQEQALNQFVKWCRVDDLGNIPIRREFFDNPFIGIAP